MGFKEKRDFFFNLYEEQHIPEPFKNITYFKNPGSILLEQLLDKKSSNSIFYSIKSVPEYIIANGYNTFKSKIIPQFHKGYAIQLDNDFKTVDDYLKFQFKSKAKTYRRYVRRLEECFDTSSVMYYGEITKNDYNFLFDALKKMLETRFEQKKEKNERLLEWQRIYSMFFALINDSKASIFVVYDSKKPISISLNYHFNQFLFSAITSYDIDYSKFGLGHIDIYQQLEWCIDNNYTIFDMGRGDWDYKRRWSNLIYNLNYYISTPKNKSLSVTLFSNLEVQKIRLFEFLRSKKLNIAYNNLKLFLFRLNKTESAIDPYKIDSIKNAEIINDAELLDKNFADNHPYLNKPVYDFLYSNAVHIDNIKIYKCLNTTYSFIITGNKKSIKVIFN